MSWQFAALVFAIGICMTQLILWRLPNSGLGVGLRLAVVLLVAGVKFLTVWSWVGIILVSATIGCMIWEKLRPRNQYQFEFTNNERLRVSLGVLISGGVDLLISTGLKGWMAPMPPRWGLEANGTPLWIQGVIALFLFDFMYYTFHRLQHHYDWWWQFHKVHHATRELTSQAGSVANVLDLLGSSSIPFFLVQIGLDISPQAILFGYVIPLNLISGLFAHVNVNFPRGCPWWARIINNPNTHAMHHQFDSRCNYGRVFLLFDTLFGTFKAAPADGMMTFGIEDEEFTKMGLFRQVVHGVVQNAAQLKRR